MNQPPRIASSLGLAALIALAGASSHVRADDVPGDLEAEIRAFETEKRSELDEAIAEVAAALDQQRHELAIIQEMVAKSEAALARLEAMKRALDSIDANTAAIAEPFPVGRAMPPLPTRSTPEAVSLTAGPSTPAPDSACCSIEPPAPPAPAPAGWKPGAAEARGSDARVLTLPDGTLRIVPYNWAEAPDPAGPARIVRGISATTPAPMPDDAPAPEAPADDYAELVGLLRGVLSQLESMDGGDVPPPSPPPTPGVVYPSPSSIVPTP